MRDPDPVRARVQHEPVPRGQPLERLHDRGRGLAETRRDVVDRARVSRGAIPDALLTRAAHRTDTGPVSPAMTKLVLLLVAALPALAHAGPPAVSHFSFARLAAGTDALWIDAVDNCDEGGQLPLAI